MKSCQLTLPELRNIVLQGESDRIEFKKSTRQLKSGFQTICAFLNSTGGTIFFGVNDNRELLGQSVSDNTKRELANELKKLEPTPMLNIVYTQLENKKHIISVEAHHDMHAPYQYDGRTYQRNQSTTEKMSQHRYEQMIIERAYLNHSWESYLNDKYLLEMMDQKLIHQVIKDAVYCERIPESALKNGSIEILARFSLIEDSKLKNAASVLFAKECALDLPQCVIKMSRFRGSDKYGQVIDSKHVYANAFTLLDEANAFIKKHLMISSFFERDTVERIDRPTLPRLAIREALVNAICHRDYSDRTGSIMLAIYDDKLELWNNGSLPNGLTIKDLSKKHFSKAQNPIIAKVFYYAGLIETWGTGINRMIKFCKNDGVPAPKFKELSGGVNVIFKFRESIANTLHENVEVSSVSINRLKPLDRQEKIYQILVNADKLSSREIHQTLKKVSFSVGYSTLKGDLGILEKKGRIKRVGSGKSTLWEAILA